MIKRRSLGRLAAVAFTAIVGNTEARNGVGALLAPCHRGRDLWTECRMENSSVSGQGGRQAGDRLTD